MRHRLAEVVQERGALRGLDRGLDLGGHDARELHDLEGVLEHVLSVARPEAQAAEDLHELVADLSAVRFEHRLLTRLPDVLVELDLGEVVHLLDARRMDAAVLDQLQQRHSRDLPANAVERREHDRVGRVVDDEVDAREMFERADVAALTPDDPPLHVVRRELDERDSRLRGRARRDPLQRVGDQVPRPALRLGLSFLLHLAHAARELVTHLLLRIRQDPLPRLPHRHARDPFELQPLAVPELLHLILQLAQVNLAVGHTLFTPGQLGELPVDVVLLRDDALLDLHHRVATLAELRLELGTQLHRLLARLDPRFPARRVGLSLSLVEEPGADASRVLDPRPAEQPDREQRSDESNRDSDHDCHRDGHGRSYGFGHPHAALPTDRRFPARSRAPFSVSVQGVCLGGLWRCQADR